MPAAFPISYAMDNKNFIQGPTKLFMATYLVNGADAPTGTMTALGLIDKAGIEFDHKLTFAETEVDQFTTPADAFMTKQEYDIKFNLVEMSPANVLAFLGAAAGSLSVNAGVSTQLLGEPQDVSATTTPSMRALYKQFLFQFPSTGHDQTTSPIGAYGYIQLFKAYIQAHGAIKFSKDNLAMVNVTVRALTDLTVSGAGKVGKIIQQ